MAAPVNADFGRSLRSKCCLVQPRKDAEQRGLLRIAFKDSYIGHGVFAKKHINKGDIVCQYKGDLCQQAEWERRLEIDSTFMFFFHSKGKHLCIDSTSSSGAGRMINDDHRHPNCKVRVMGVEDNECLMVVAMKDIFETEEITFDYGVKDAPWRKKNAVRKEVYQEPEFLHVKPDIVSYSRKGTEIGRFTMKNPICLIGKSKDADVIVSLPGEKDVHCQLELCQGEVLLTDENRVERFLQRNDKFFVMDREFQIDFPVEAMASMHMDSGRCTDDRVNDIIIEQNYDLDESHHTATSKDVEKDDEYVESENEANDNNSLMNFHPDESENIAGSDCNEGSHSDDSEKIFVKEFVNMSYQPDTSSDFAEDSDADKSYQPDKSSDFADDSDEDKNYQPYKSSDFADDSDTDKNYHPDDSDDSKDEFAEEIDVCEPSEPETDDSTCSTIFQELRPEKTMIFQTSKPNSQGNLNNKVHCCLFCDKVLPNIARHLELVHKNEHDVARVLLLPKKSADRRRAWSRIVNKGDFNHNYSVYNKGHGMIIPKYRIREDRKAGLHVPCMFCRALYMKSDLWKHQQTCVAKGDQNSQYRPVRSGKLLMPIKNASKGLFENVICKMKEDNVKNTVLSDDLIVHYGNVEYQEKCHIEHNRGYLSNRLRELARLLLAAKEIDHTINSISDLLINKNWDLLVKSVKIVAIFDEKTRMFGVPSLADKLGQHIKNCAEILRFEALKKDDNETITLMDTFIEMHRTGWSKEVSSAARYTLKENKYNKPQLLPVVADIVNLNKFLDENAEQLCKEIKTNINIYPNLAKVVLAKIILFNRKRSGEAERMTLSQLEKAKTGDIVDPVMKNTLSEFEQRLCRSHLRVEIRGKKGRNVPVLLTEKMLKGLNVLIEYRSAAGVKEERLVFARPGNSESPYRGCDAHRVLAQSCEACIHPENITSTKLRKQMATCAQLLNMRDFEQDLLATFQGHDIRVHRQFYRLPDSTLQIAKISKVLHSINTGTIQKYKGVTLMKSNLKKMSDIFSNSETMEEESDDEETDERNLFDCDVTEDDVPSLPTHEVKKPPSGSKGVKRKKRDSCIKVGSKQPMDHGDKIILEREFAEFIKQERVPGKVDILNFSRRCILFQKYDWKKIKYAVYNMILSRSKKVRFM